MTGMSDGTSVHGRASGDSVSRRRVWPMRVPLGGCVRVYGLHPRAPANFSKGVGTAEPTPLTGDLRYAPPHALSQATRVFE